MFCAGGEAGVEVRTEEWGEAGEDSGEALMGETGAGSGAGETTEDRLGVEEREGEEEEVEEDRIETGLQLTEGKGTHQVDPATERSELIIIDAHHPRPNLTTPHLGRVEKAGLGMVSRLQSRTTPAPGNHMDQESHPGIPPGRLMAPGGL